LIYCVLIIHSLAENGLSEKKNQMTFLGEKKENEKKNQQVK